jgi:Undecaprenyl-phosphate galactose phosphotransferase WbaP
METQLPASVVAAAFEGIPSSISVDRPIGTVACLATADILSIVGSLLIASLVRDRLFPIKGTPIAGIIFPASLVGSHIFHIKEISIAGIIFPALILVLCSFVAVGLYPGVSLNPVDELRLSARAISIAFLLAWSATFFLHDLSPSRLVYIVAYLLAIVLVPLARALTRKTLCHKPWWGSQVVILGFGTTGKLMYDKLKKNPVYGLKPYAVLDDNPAKIHQAEGLITGPLSRCLEITANHKISYGVVCMPGLSRQDLLDLLDRYGQCFGHLLVIPNLIGMTSLGITAKEVGGIIGLEVRQQLLRPWSKFLKRSLDLTITLLLAPIVIPVVALFAVLVMLEDAGPAFYCNERIGHVGRKFKAWKLRSMVTNGDSVLRQHFENNPLDHAHWRATQKLKHDPRLTRIGRFIRKTSIDELPQFWNVFIGEMSVVGPRPMLQSQIDMYGPAFNLYKQVRPGITGLWQVSGRNHLTFAERATLDKYVIQNWSVWLDIYILVRTGGAVISADGAY